MRVGLPGLPALEHPQALSLALALALVLALALALALALVLALALALALALTLITLTLPRRAHQRAGAAPDGRGQAVWPVRGAQQCAGHA